MNHNRLMASRLLTLTLWALVLACAVFWGLRVFAPRTAVPAEAQMPARTVALGGELRRLLGTSVADTDDEDEDLDEGSGRFHLLGVVAPRGASHSTQGVALIAVGDQPPKAWRTGATLEGDAVLLAVGQRSVQIGPRGGPATTELTLPDPSAAVTSGAAPRPMTMPVNRVPPAIAPGAVQPQQQQGMQPHAPAAQPVQRAGRAEQEDEEEDE
jgi:general secretion pathway protein C